MIIDVYYKGNFMDTFDGTDEARLYVEEKCEDKNLDKDYFTYKKHL